MNTALVQYQRASIVSEAYQHYRIKKITVTFLPQFDNFLASGGAVTKPYLYWMIDKAGAVPTNITLEGLKQMGAKPIQLDEKPVKISWRPSVLQSVMYAGGGLGAANPSAYKISPWLNTRANVVDVASGPSGIDHLGLYWYMDCLNNAPGIQYQAEVEVQFQFKKPLTTLAVSTQQAIGSVQKTLNDSPDGVVGGGDGI